MWWNKGKKQTAEDRAEELRRVREAEDDLMREALYVTLGMPQLP